jgi:hypothetical protein
VRENEREKFCSRSVKNEEHAGKWEENCNLRPAVIAVTTFSREWTHCSCYEVADRHRICISTVRPETWALCSICQCGSHEPIQSQWLLYVSYPVVYPGGEADWSPPPRPNRIKKLDFVDTKIWNF